jgi:tRNA threonylcarbamoyladenosine biosynthesis protein TsaE
MDTFISHNAAETMALGDAWGQAAGVGWVIGLCGELGAGKTQLVKGIARGLGVTERVRSPTFALVNEYWSGRRPLFHLDLYRVETWRQFQEAGLDLYLPAPAGVTVVEWFDRYAGLVGGGGRLPPGAWVRRVVIELRGENDRLIRYEDTGP